MENKSTKELLWSQYKRLYSELEGADPGSDEYGKLLKQWLEIHERLFTEDKLDVELSKKWYNKLDVNTILSAGVTIFGIVFMLKHEELHVITSKVMPWIPKPKLK